MSDMTRGTGQQLPVALASGGAGALATSVAGVGRPDASTASSMGSSVRSRDVAVLTGGRSMERDRSLLSGQAVAEALEAVGHRVRLIDTAEPGLIEGVAGVDVAFLALAGRFGEDGKLQGFLETLAVPYTGSGVLASALGMHKPVAKTVVAASGVSVLPHVLIGGKGTAESTDTAASAMRRLGAPVIVKPLGEGGSVGVAVAHDVAELEELVVGLGQAGEAVLAEPFVTGTAVSVGVLETDGGDVRALPSLAVRAAREFYDYETKRNPALHAYACPAPLPRQVTALIADASCRAHRALGCSGYSRSDFIISADGDAWWLEVNTLPGLSRTGNLATMAAAAGLSYEKLVSQILGAAMHSARYRP
ncbi:D-alanine--D-alanine ligase family protein [Geodermatophilus amargosae]|uniref:D-alanine--D-alanine ligase family protein n=1 Tax=Geodermatophilus amargosae TaxID=1296565 RepID=UPI0034DDF0D1